MMPGTIQAAKAKHKQKEMKFISKQRNSSRIFIYAVPINIIEGYKRSTKIPSKEQPPGTLSLSHQMGLCFTKSRDIPIASTSASESSPRPSNQAPRIPQEQHNPTLSKPASTSSKATSTSEEIRHILGKPYVDINSIYVLDRELGRGQFGITYLCTEKATGQKYACKSIARRKLATHQDIEDVRREILMLQHLTGQPNIVEFRGVYEDRENLHLVMELCSGGELFDRIIAKGSYSEREAASIARQIVNVVHVCHFMGVMHRDVKPENFLMVSKDENSPIKATDFGLSVFIEEG